MTDSDIQLNERELGITLPDFYKHAVIPFRIPALVGNTEWMLWDDARRLIALNHELRAGSRFRPAWPAHLFAVGDPHGDELMALDTRTPEGPVWWLDHGMVDSKSSYESHPRFADWVEQFYRDTRSDLEGDGYDADGTPERLEAARTAGRNQGLVGCLIFIVVFLIAAGALVYFR